MEREELMKIMSSDADCNWDGDNALNGLKVLEKYTNKDLITGAGHDVIYSIGVDEAIEKGITRADLEYLRKQNWMIEHDGFACFV